jgi:hypothetical protein
MIAAILEIEIFVKSRFPIHGSLHWPFVKGQEVPDVERQVKLVISRANRCEPAWAHCSALKKPKRMVPLNEEAGMGERERASAVSMFAIIPPKWVSRPDARSWNSEAASRVAAIRTIGESGRTAGFGVDQTE